MILDLRDLTLAVGPETHIHPTTLRLQPGGLTVLLGATLAGKTSLMRLMAGLIRPSAGAVLVDGVDVTRRPVRHRQVAMVHQMFVNYPNMNVYDNIASPLRVARMPEAEIRRRTHAMAELLRLERLLQRRPGELSGGQQQRTAIARALVKDAGLVLLDEPLANLDFKLREELRDELPRLLRQRESIVVYATTEPGEALLLGGQTATLFQGRVAAVGPTDRLYRAPDSLIAAQVMSDPPINLTPADHRASRITSPAGLSWAAPPGLPEGPLVVALRPHHLTLAQGAVAPATLALEATSLIAELSGSETTLHVRIGGAGGAGLSWVSLSHGVHATRVGDRVRLQFDPGDCLYFDATTGLRLATGHGDAGAPLAPAKSH